MQQRIQVSVLQVSLQRIKNIYINQLVPYSSLATPLEGQDAKILEKPMLKVTLATRKAQHIAPRSKWIWRIGDKLGYI